MYNFKTIGINHILDLLDKIPTKAPVREPIIPFLEKRRYIPQESSKENFSFFNINTVPQLKEPLECLDPEHPATHVAIMKSVQAGITTSIAENMMIYYIMNQIGNVLYLISSNKMAKMRGQHIDVMIDNVEGMAKLISPMSKRRGAYSSRTADKLEYKEFEGGIQFVNGSYGSTATMKSIPYVGIILDEWSEAPIEVKGQGSTDKLIEGRTFASSFFKILYLSTPSHSGTCLIEKAFLQGDQREWFVPCPYCGCMQTLVMRQNEQKHGLTFEIEKTSLGEIRIIPDTIGYNCIGCEKMFFYEHKREFMKDGEWRPTFDEHVPKSENHRSYHMSALIAPFFTWERVCQAYTETNMGKDKLEYAAFSINILGLPYFNLIEKPDWRKLKEKAEEYCLGEVPDAGNKGIVLLGGADVQQNRVELCICAFGEDLECWLIERKVFHFQPGQQHAFEEGAWRELVEFVYEYKHPTIGEILRVCIDSRYDPIKRVEGHYDVDDEKRKGVVESFCDSYFNKFTAIKGVSDKYIPVVVGDKKTIKQSNTINTDKLKHLIFSNLYKKNGPSVVHFPKYALVEDEMVVLNDFIFKSFCSEQFVEDEKGKMHWKKFFSKNEVLDCVVYAFAAAHYEKFEKFTHEQWQELREELLVGSE